MRFSTKAVHAGQRPDPATGAINVPVYLTSTYALEAPGKHRGYAYSRTDHPTRAALEEKLAVLEEGRFGLCFASGLAAEDTVLHLLGTGDRVVAALDLYGGSQRLFKEVWERHGVTFSFVDTTRPEKVEAALRGGAKMLWLESPSNPMLEITDLRETAEIAHRQGTKVVVDNTFATPYLQRPLACGADIVIHSTTKYLGGHSDVLGGAVVTNDPETFDRLKSLQNSTGAVPGPLDCFLVLRGVKTLPLRMDRHCANAVTVAGFLQDHADVKQVRYPGLPSHPGHVLAKKQMDGFGGMISLELEGGP
ncbi:MAG: trans-sulfuration enzyme family protein, partial [Planctomycetota bacterium]